VVSMKEAYYSIRGDSRKWQIESVCEDTVTLKRHHWFKDEQLEFDKGEWNDMMLSGRAWKVN